MFKIIKIICSFLLVVSLSETGFSLMPSKQQVLCADLKKFKINKNSQNVCKINQDLCELVEEMEEDILVAMHVRQEVLRAIVSQRLKKAFACAIVAAELSSEECKFLFEEAQESELKYILLLMRAPNRRPV